MLIALPDFVYEFFERFSLNKHVLFMTLARRKSYTHSGNAISACLERCI